MEQVESQEKRLKAKVAASSISRHWVLMGLGLVTEVGVLGSLVYAVDMQVDDGARQRQVELIDAAREYEDLIRARNKDLKGARMSATGSIIVHPPTYGGIVED